MIDELKKLTEEQKAELTKNLKKIVGLQDKIKFKEEVIRRVDVLLDSLQDIFGYLERAVTIIEQAGKTSRRENISKEHEDCRRRFMIVIDMLTKDLDEAKILEKELTGLTQTEIGAKMNELFGGHGCAEIESLEAEILTTKTDWLSRFLREACESCSYKKKWKKLIKEVEND